MTLSLHYTLVTLMYKNFEHFIFRTPYYPITALSNFNKVINEPSFREMLQIASPDLTKKLGCNEKKILYALYRYYQRACTRPTPFGLFAGTSIGRFEGKFTNISLVSSQEYKRFTRLNVDIICNIIGWLEKNEIIRLQLHYFPNNTLLKIGNYYRYNSSYNQRTYRIQQVENSEYLEKILIDAQKGKCISELSALLVDDDITIDEANCFISELIRENILVSELNLAATDSQPLDRIFGIVKNLSMQDNSVIEFLFKIISQLNIIDREILGCSFNNYSDIKKAVESVTVISEPKEIFQTDLYKPVKFANVGSNVLKSIQEVLVFLNKMTPHEPNVELEVFKKEFLKRYESRELPLLFVLDSELGIGYGASSSDVSPLVDNLFTGRINHQIESRSTSFHSIILQKCKCLPKYTVELTEEDVKNVTADWDDVPPTISVVCEILQDDQNGQLIYIKSVYGPTATAWTGRFCYLNKQISDHVLSIAKKENQMFSDVLVAEISHMPQTRAKNAFLHPVLHTYEIPCLANASVHQDFRIELKDLYVSVRDNRIVLRSKKLNREVVPRLSNAHNYSDPKSLPIYRFLCDMQHQVGRIGFGVQYRQIIEELGFLPRIVYKNCILVRASWLIHGKEISHFVNIEEDSNLLQETKKWQIKRGIPDRVLFVEGDNELYIDMNNPLSIKSWLSVIKNRRNFILVEFLFNQKSAVVHDCYGEFTNEFIFAFYNE